MKRVIQFCAVILTIVMMLTMTACGCKHENVAVDAAVAATCTETGLTEGKHCADCGEVIVAQTTIPANGHTEVDVEAADPTCEDEGHSAGKMCSVCKASLSGADKIAALGHTWKAATCDAPKTCTVCNKTDGEPLSHQWDDATCEKAKTCKLCKKTDGKALGHTKGLGKCTRCNKNEATLNPTAKKIRTAFREGMDQLDKSLDKIGDALNSRYYTGTASAVLALGFAGNEFEDVVALCGNHSEFADIKKNCQEIQELIENTFSGTVDVHGDYRDLSTLDKMLDTMNDIAPYLKSAGDELDSWSSFL